MALDPFSNEHENLTRELYNKPILVRKWGDCELELGHVDGAVVEYLRSATTRNRAVLVDELHERGDAFCRSPRVNPTAFPDRFLSEAVGERERYSRLSSNSKTGTVASSETGSKTIARTA